MTTLKVNIDEFLKSINSDKKRVEVLANGRWFIIGFIAFQYGSSLNPKNRMHKSVIDLLDSNEIDYKSVCYGFEVKETSIRPQEDPNNGVKDKDKDKDMYLKKERESLREEEKKTAECVDAVYQAYPRKKDPGHARKAIRAALKKVSFEDLLAAVKKFAESVKGRDPQYVPYPASWFNGECWDDEEDQKEEYNPLIHGTRFFSGK
jgi:hypothetical protein